MAIDVESLLSGQLGSYRSQVRFDRSRSGSEFTCYDVNLEMVQPRLNSFDAVQPHIFPARGAVLCGEAELAAEIGDLRSAGDMAVVCDDPGLGRLRRFGKADGVPFRRDVL